MTDAWTWRAYYTDGSHLDEDDAEGFASVDLTRVVAFELRPNHDGLPTPHVRIEPGSGKRPIFFRRRRRIVNPELGDVGPGPTVHCLGWQANSRDGRNHKALTFWFEDGSVLLTDDHGAV